MYSLTIDLKEDREVYEQKTSHKSSPLSEGALLYQSGDVDQAAKVFDQLLKVDPNNYDSRVMLAEIYHEQCIKEDTNCEQAMWQLDYLIEKFPRKIKPLEMRSKLFLKLNDTISSRNDVVTISNLK